MSIDAQATVEVWRVPLDRDSGWDSASLSGVEADRARRFRFDVDRQRYIHSHIALRKILSRYLDVSPGELVFTAGPQGKPALAGCADVRFNLSHAGELALVAVCLTAEVGVDVEQPQRLKQSGRWVERSFSGYERAALDTLAGDDRAEALARLWVCKEAWIKALGIGLSRPLDSFDILVDLSAPPRLLATRPDPSEAIGWSLALVDVGAAYVAAVAARTACLDVIRRDY